MEWRCAVTNYDIARMDQTGLEFAARFIISATLDFRTLDLFVHRKSGAPPGAFPAA